MLSELKREFALRKKVYPKWIPTKMHRKDALTQMQRLKATIDLLEELLSKEQGEQTQLFL
ncbi:hypothetical protein [Bernardetia sp.]|uniref:hypothetical protein n=1 Tax=Bernardetia sp. TaxID=1937974 RepID=UPI0025C0C35C|nr:hypothetical protein [Bernardetia sp.]